MKVSVIAKRIQEELIGRAAVNVEDLMTLGKYLVPGDHLEIGTLFGCSAIFAALVKDSGTVTCLDPLDGYYMNVEWLASLEDISGSIPSIELLQKNADRFEVELNVVQALSHPWPLKDARFATVYIDGDHWDDGPANDWNNVKDCTSDYVIFHDYSFPAVKAVCHGAAMDSEWEFIEQTGSSYVVGRR